MMVALLELQRGASNMLPAYNIAYNLLYVQVSNWLPISCVFERSHYFLTLLWKMSDYTRSINAIGQTDTSLN